MKFRPRPLVKVLFVLGLSTLQFSSLAAESTAAILNRAASHMGTPYRSGGMSPGGFDCSGFVSYLYRPTVPTLPRVSRQMAVFGEAVARGSWQPGDLLFYATGSDPSRINHVAIWYGDGHVIHSISDGPETGVVLSPANARYWNRRYVSARRVLPVETTATEASPSVTAPPPPEELAPTNIEDSPWNEFEGFLRGDFEAWKQADEEAFEAYKRENG